MTLFFSIVLGIIFWASLELISYILIVYPIGQDKVSITQSSLHSTLLIFGHGWYNCEIECDESDENVDTLSVNYVFSKQDATRKERDSDGNQTKETMPQKLNVCLLCDKYGDHASSICFS